MSKRRVPSHGLALGLLLAAAGGVESGAPEEPEALFERALEKAAKGKFDGAITEMENFREAKPDAAEVYRNLGEWYLEASRPARALEAWMEYRELAPDDWRWREGFIETYQALGQTELRDQERRDLIKARGASANPELRSLRHFRRERFSVRGRRASAFELFEPEAERGIIYEFKVPLYNGKDDLLYYWASPDWEVHVARKLGILEEGKRPYSLDYVISREGVVKERGLLEKPHFKDPPPYEFVRDLVVKKLARPPGA